MCTGNARMTTALTPLNAARSCSSSRRAPQKPSTTCAVPWYLHARWLRLRLRLGVVALVVFAAVFVATGCAERATTGNRSHAVYGQAHARTTRCTYTCWRDLAASMGKIATVAVSPASTPEAILNGRLVLLSCCLLSEDASEEKKGCSAFHRRGPFPAGAGRQAGAKGTGSKKNLRSN
jgi:hypothetical protein